MQKAKKNMRKINFNKVVAQKFKEYDQKLEALTSINVFEVIEKTNTDDLSDMELKLKLLNRMRLNKSYENYDTHQQLYNTLYDSVTIDQEALEAQDAEPSFHKRTHDEQDPPNDHIGETGRKKRKDAGDPSSRSLRKDKTPRVQAQEDTFADQPQDQEDTYVQQPPNVGWFTKKLGSANAKRRTTWFDLLLKSDIYQNEHLEGVGLEKLKKQYKNDVELEYHVDQLKETVFTKAQCNSGEGDVSKPRSFESHMSKSTKPHPNFYNNYFYYLVNLSTREKYATSLTNHYATRSPDKVYSNKRIILVVRVNVKRKWDNRFLSSIVVRRLDRKEYALSYVDLPRLNLNDIEDMYLLKVQDKLHHLQSCFEKDFNNILLLFIQRTVILNRVEDLQLGVESYQRTLNLTKPKLYFEGIKDNIPYTMFGTKKGIRENLIDMVNKNELDKIENPLSPNYIEHGYSICCENTIDMINSIKDLREENRDMFLSINDAIKLMLAVATNMSCVVENDIRKEGSKDNLKE
ncbi:hypothetical protein Tco_1017004 [Tanacetum coccineum]|uniref:Uncharacterized protein n=1 Tax=Tanacetum coccineum TaxID=301880 RepID=A0ABQ5FRB1_9ASTR